VRDGFGALVVADAVGSADSLSLSEADAVVDAGTSE
jgi:hypothetical protein